MRFFLALDEPVGISLKLQTPEVIEQTQMLGTEVEFDDRLIVNPDRPSPLLGEKEMIRAVPTSAFAEAAVVEYAMESGPETNGAGKTIVFDDDVRAFEERVVTLEIPPHLLGLVVRRELDGVLARIAQDD
jgi:hypothetical protein